MRIGFGIEVSFGVLRSVTVEELDTEFHVVCHYELYTASCHETGEDFRLDVILVLVHVLVCGGDCPARLICLGVSWRC